MIHENWQDAFHWIESPSHGHKYLKMDEQYLKPLTHGRRSMDTFPEKPGGDSNRKRIQRRMRLTGV